MKATPFYAAHARYFLHVLIGLNQFVCTLFGGWPDETISSYLWRLDQQGKPAGRWLRPAVDAIFRALFSQRDHCRQAALEEVERVQLPPMLR